MKNKIVCFRILTEHKKKSFPDPEKARIGKIDYSSHRCFYLRGRGEETSSRRKRSMVCVLSKYALKADCTLNFYPTPLLL